MDKVEYTILRNNVALVGTLVRQWDIEGALAAIDRADSIGVLVDPTAWRDGQEEMHKYERVLRKLLDFKLAVIEHSPGDGTEA